ncbi:thymidylate synthase family protein [Pseudomonas fitomaticsae]
MAVLIQHDRVVSAWLAAARHLATCPDYVARNLVLEIASPGALEAQDRDVICAVDAAIRRRWPKLSVQTVAGTIFPNEMYRRDGRPAFYESYLNAMARGMKGGTWGTYAHRMMRRVSRDGKTIFNPLEVIVRKLQASKAGRCYQAVYELGVVDIEYDIEDDGFGFELPLYDPATDGNKPMNMPCLSHLSFKVTGDKLDLTAVYRSHWYGQRALGNLIGLSNLHKFVSDESKFERGILTCIATHAFLDVESLGGAAEAKQMLAAFPS